jgi:hypothetical protein
LTKIATNQHKPFRTGNERFERPSLGNSCAFLSRHQQFRDGLSLHERRFSSSTAIPNNTASKHDDHKASKAGNEGQDRVLQAHALSALHTLEESPIGIDDLM